MLIRRKKNKGFTLVEVIVSMLVLSITIVSVLTAFSLSAKSNTQTKKRQSAEALVEDLVEYTKAYASNLDPEKGLDELNYFTDRFSGSCTVEQELTDTVKVEKSTITGVMNGFFEYTIKVTRDTDVYAELNDHEIVSFGATGSHTALLDASHLGNDTIKADGSTGANSINDYDDLALKIFQEYNQLKVETDNALAQLLITPAPTPLPTPSPIPTLTPDEVMGKIDREVVLEVSSPEADKMQLNAYMVYKANTDLQDAIPAEADTELKMEFYTSAVFDAPSVPDSSAQRLDQIYLLYSPWGGDALGERGKDVRVSDPSGVLDADIYLVYQKESTDAIVDSIGKGLGDRFNSGEKIIVIFDNVPNRADLYSSVSLDVGTITNVTKHEKQMVSTTSGLRVQELTIEVIDPDTNKVLETRTVTCLR